MIETLQMQIIFSKLYKSIWIGVMEVPETSSCSNMKHFFIITCDATNEDAENQDKSKDLLSNGVGDQEIMEYSA